MKKLVFIIILLAAIISCAYQHKQYPTEISYLGPPGSFTYLAAEKKFPAQLLVNQNSIEDCFISVHLGKTEKAIIPFKNSIGGIVETTQSALSKFSDIQVEDSLDLPISQNLMVTSGTTDIKKIYSHPQALKQCQHFIDSIYPAVPRIESSSTSAAAKWVSEHPEENGAAIGNIEAAKMYKLKIIYTNIQDNKNNTTQFIIISKKNKRYK